MCDTLKLTSNLNNFGIYTHASFGPQFKKDMQLYSLANIFPSNNPIKKPFNFGIYSRPVLH